MTDCLKLKIGNHFENIPVLNLYWLIHFHNHHFSKSQLVRIHAAFEDNKVFIDEMKNANLDAYSEEEWCNLKNGPICNSVDSDQEKV